MGDEIGGDGVGANDTKREAPRGNMGHIDDGIKGGEYEEAPAAGKEGPSGSPDAFDRGAEARVVGCEAQSEEDDAGDGEVGYRLRWRRIGLRWRVGLVWQPGSLPHAQPASGDEAQDHRAESGDEAE